MKANLKLIFYLVFLINYVTCFHFDFVKEGEKCIIEEFFNDTVSLINFDFLILINSCLYLM